MDIIENITYDELYGIIRDVERFNVFINIVINTADLAYNGEELYFHPQIIDAFIRELAGDEYDTKLEQLRKEKEAKEAAKKEEANEEE